MKFWELVSPSGQPRVLLDVGCDRDRLDVSPGGENRRARTKPEIDQWHDSTRPGVLAADRNREKFKESLSGFWTDIRHQSRHRNWLGASNKKNSELMSERGPLARRVFESTSKK